MLWGRWGMCALSASHCIVLDQSQYCSSCRRHVLKRLYCLQVLSNSYAFAYFFFGGDLFKGEFTAEQNLTNKNLFEDIQEQLGQEVGGFYN